MKNATDRYLAVEPKAFLKRPLARIQPLLARRGEPNIDLDALAELIKGVGVLEEPIAIKSPEHWAKVVNEIPDSVDAILPVSVAAYPTEMWNSHPQPLLKRGLPFVFWPIIKYDEPDFWRWAATDFLTAIGLDVHLVQSNRDGVALLRALAMKRFLRKSKIVVFGKQNFPWNAPAAGHLVTESLGTRIVVRSLTDMRKRYSKFSDSDVAALWKQRANRYCKTTVKPAELKQAIRSYLAVRSIMEDEKALGFGVNCFGELIIDGGRDTPCLAQTLLREDGYIASCDGDYLAMMSMVLTTFFLDKTCMMSNMYPIRYKGALKDHFGDPLAPDRKRYPEKTWKNLARLGHCGFIGVVSPEMTKSGRGLLKDWGGTYEIKRDGRGCGVDADLVAGRKVTAVQLKFDGKTLLIGDAEVCETTRHSGMRHCEATALIKFRDLEGFTANISREHSVLVYGEHIPEFRALSRVLGLDCRVF